MCISLQGASTIYCVSLIPGERGRREEREKERERESKRGRENKRKRGRENKRKRGREGETQRQGGEHIMCNKAPKKTISYTLPSQDADKADLS